MADERTVDYRGLADYLAAQTDPNAAEAAREAAARRTRRSVRPEGGRQEGALTAGLEGAIPSMGAHLAQILQAPGRAASGYYDVQPEVPGQWSEADQFRETNARQRMAEDAIGLGTALTLGAPTSGAGPGGFVLGSRGFKPGAGRTNIGHNQPPPEARFPQYAEAYPAAGPPAPAWDKVKKQEYMEKAPTPESAAFNKERERIMKDMKREGFTPMFDPAQRYHVDPANYPPNVDTTSIIPKKQATIDKHMETIGSPESRDRLRTAYERGATMPNTADWYAMGQLEDAFVKELGPEAGRKAFQDRIATSMATTTGGADPRSNWLMAAYGNYLKTKGMPLPEASHQYPYPIGGRYAANNMKMFQRASDEGGFSSLGLENPKRHEFAQAFMGNPRAGTMDEQMTSGMTPGKMLPGGGQYGLYQRVMNEEAANAGVDPRRFQEVAWSGFKNIKDPKYTEGQPFIQTINESIERTHRLTGMPREEILRRGVIEGSIPMYSIPAAAALGAAGMTREDQQ